MATKTIQKVVLSEVGSAPTLQNQTVEINVSGGVQTGSDIVLTKNTSAAVAPEIHLNALNGSWLLGIDVANGPGARDFVLAAKKDFPTPGAVNDLIYISHNGTGAPTIGLGQTPPDTSHRVQIAAYDPETGMGCLKMRKGPSQVGNIVTVVDSSNTARWWLDSDFYLKGASVATGASVSVKADDTNGRSLALTKADGTVVYGFTHVGNNMNIRYVTGGADIMEFTTAGRVRFYSANGIKVDAEVALGGGATATLGTIGGSGPAGAAQVGWEKHETQSGVRFIPLFA